MSQNLAVVEAARLPYPDAAARMGVESSAWQTLVNAIFPNARTAEGVILALNYCKARRLDVFRRPVHIVPIRTRFKNADGKEYWNDVESVWIGIDGLRSMAEAGGDWSGLDPATFGPDAVGEWELPSGDDDGGDHPNAPPREKKAPAAPPKMLRVVYPEWCQVTVYKIMKDGQRVPFPGPRVYWLETYATAGKSDRPNEMWKDRPRGQLEKCAEAAALRRAFPGSMGDTYLVEEAPRMVDVTPAAAASDKRPDRSEISAKAKPAAKAIEVSKEDRSAPIQSKPAGDTLVVTVTDGEISGTSGPDKPLDDDAEEKLRHALDTLPKLSSIEEIRGARQSLKAELPADQFAVWNSAAYSREKQLQGGRR